MSDYTQKELNKMPYQERLRNQPDEDSPIAITMHWMTGTATSFAFLFDGIDFPLREIALQGSHPSGYPEAGGFSWFEQERDFYEVLTEAEQAPLIRKETDKIARFIKALREMYSAKLVVTGMSQGGDLSLHLACHYPELVDLSCPIAGRLSEPMRPDAIAHQTLPDILMLNGCDDEIVTVESARDVASWLKTQNFKLSLNEYDGIGHDINAEMIEDIRKAIAKL